MRFTYEVLTEAAKGVRNLKGTDIIVRVEIIRWGFVLRYWDEVKDEEPYPPAPIYGHIEVLEPEAAMAWDPCDDAYIVGESEAASGWGPLLYDVAIEVATVLGNGLSPDRYIVSADAHRVWTYYATKRRDVKAHQLDDPENTLTPKPQDNCPQDAARKWAKSSLGNQYDWPKDPLSKRYTARPKRLKALAKADKLDVTSIRGANPPARALVRMAAGMRD